MVIRVFPDGVLMMAPRLPRLKSYSFFISCFRTSSFSRRGWSGGDKPQNVPTPRVDNDEKPSQCVHAECNETVLFINGIIQNRESHVVQKYRGGISEVDPVIL